jgi:DNA-binding GntR family transcriptional regulator
MSMTRDAFDRIRDAIVSGGLELGEHLSETAISRALGMSKAPVRAAFIELRDKGLVTVVPQSGTYVFSPSAEDVRTMSEFRALLEDRAMREAYRLNRAVMFERLERSVKAMRKALPESDWELYRRADNAYHMAFLEECGNPYLLRAYNLTSSTLEALRVRLQGGTGNFRERSFREHLEMVDLLQAGKVDEAAAVLREHILIINEWVGGRRFRADKGTRKLKGEDRDYTAIFAKSRRSSLPTG